MSHQLIECVRIDSAIEACLSLSPENAEAGLADVLDHRRHIWPRADVTPIARDVELDSRSLVEDRSKHELLMEFSSSDAPSDGERLGTPFRSNNPYRELTPTRQLGSP